MKNIHILPAKIPDNLIKCIKDCGGKKVGDFILGYFPEADKELWQHVNMYITKQEDLKENDYIITEDGQLVQISYLLAKDVQNATKVVLTTDPDLVLDNIQHIDNDFLEWFVKNPCEFVEIQKWFDGLDFLEYKIIIPQEEPKQETLTYTEAAKKEERIFNSTMVSKQETLEEAAERYATKQVDISMREDTLEFSKSGEELYQESKIDFIEGAEYQAKRMYSEKDLKKAFHVGRLYQGREETQHLKNGLNNLKRNKMENKLFLKKIDTSYTLHRITDNVLTIEGDSKYVIGGVDPFYKLSKENCDEIFGIVDVKLMADFYGASVKGTLDFKLGANQGFEAGFNKALEVLGDKKFSERDMIFAYNEGTNDGSAFESMCQNDDNDIEDYAKQCMDEFIQSLKQNEWEVEIEMDRIPADRAPNGWDEFPKLDANGCIILKRKDDKKREE